MSVKPLTVFKLIVHAAVGQNNPFIFLLENVADSKNIQLYMYCYVVNIIIMSIIMITRCGEYIIQLYLVVYSCMHYTSW